MFDQRRTLRCNKGLALLKNVVPLRRVQVPNLLLGKATLDIVSLAVLGEAKARKVIVNSFEQMQATRTVVTITHKASLRREGSLFS